MKRKRERKTKQKSTIPFRHSLLAGSCLDEVLAMARKGSLCASEAGLLLT
jgi:hypothetical protein